MRSHHITLLVILIATAIVMVLAPQAFADNAIVQVTITKNASTNQTCVKNSNCFDPINEQILADEVIEWKNLDTTFHTVTSGKPSDTQSGILFDSKTIKPGGIFDYTFNNVGVFDYYCKVHPWMTGVITVMASPNQVTATTNSSSILPTANAGIPQTVKGRTTVALDGNNSSDPYSLPLVYFWTQTSGPKVVLSNFKTASPTFTAPSINSTTPLTFQLVVSDGLNSKPSIVTITVQAPNSAVPEFGVVTPIIFLTTILSIVIITKVHGLGLK